MDFHIYRTRGGIARLRTIEDGEGEKIRVLQIGGAYESATYLGSRWYEPVVEYYRAFDRAFEAEGALPGNAGDGYGEPFVIRRTLMIGGGGCSYPKHLLMSHPEVSMDVIELDPKVAKIARKHFFVDELERQLQKEGREDHFRLVVGEGSAYLQANEQPYDMIINDAFLGPAPDAYLASAEGAQLIHSNLSPLGLLLMNVVVGEDLEDHGFLRAVLDAFASVFTHVHLLLASDEELSSKDNYLVIATDNPHEFEGAIV